jgi:hypothetical protein
VAQIAEGPLTTEMKSDIVSLLIEARLKETPLMAPLGVVTNDAAACVDSGNLLVDDGFGAAMTIGQIDVSYRFAIHDRVYPSGKMPGTAVEVGTERL